MFLSKLVLDPRHPLARRDLGDAYEMHRTLVRAFVPNEFSPPQRFLWRLERPTDSQHVGRCSNVVLVQSAQEADWSILDLQPGYAEEVFPNKEVDLRTLIKHGASYRFRLLANPTVTRAGKRYGLAREEEQLVWIARQGERHGFSVLGCVRAADARLQLSQGSSGNRITVHTALFEGVLQVVNAEALREGVLKGLGHTKALGLGLLSLAKLA